MNELCIRSRGWSYEQRKELQEAITGGMPIQEMGRRFDRSRTSIITEIYKVGEPHEYTAEKGQQIYEESIRRKALPDYHRRRADLAYNRCIQLLDTGLSEQQKELVEEAIFYLEEIGVSKRLRTSLTPALWEEALKMQKAGNSIIRIAFKLKLSPSALGKAFKKHRDGTLMREPRQTKVGKPKPMAAPVEIETLQEKLMRKYVKTN